MLYGCFEGATKALYEHYEGARRRYTAALRALLRRFMNIMKALEGAGRRYTAASQVLRRRFMTSMKALKGAVRLVCERYKSAL